MNNDLMSKEEDEILILALATGMREKGFNKEDGLIVLEWARKIRIEHTLLEMVLNKKMNLNVENKKIGFQLKEKSDV